MSKKDLTKPIPNRQPTSDEIDTFVRAGAGNDTVKQDSVNTELKNSVRSETARLTVDLPRDMHRRFKIACTVAGTKMNDEIRQFIDRRSVELETSSE